MVLAGDEEMNERFNPYENLEMKGSILMLFTKIEHIQDAEQDEEFVSGPVEFASFVREKFMSLELRRETQRAVNKSRHYLFLSHSSLQGGERDYATKVCSVRREGESWNTEEYQPAKEKDSLLGRYRCSSLRCMKGSRKRRSEKTVKRCV